MLDQIRRYNEEVTNLNEEFGLKEDECSRLSVSFEENMNDLKNLAAVHTELLNKYDIIQKDHEMLNITLKKWKRFKNLSKLDVIEKNWSNITKPFWKIQKF